MFEALRSPRGHLQLRADERALRSKTWLRNRANRRTCQVAATSFQLAQGARTRDHPGLYSHAASRPATPTPMSSSFRPRPTARLPGTASTTAHDLGAVLLRQRRRGSSDFSLVLPASPLHPRPRRPFAEHQADTVEHLQVRNCVRDLTHFIAEIEGHGSLGLHRTPAEAPTAFWKTTTSRAAYCWCAWCRRKGQLRRSSRRGCDVEVGDLPARPAASSR